MAVSSALLIVLLIVLLHSAVNFAKEGVGVLGYVIALFSSGFTKGTAPAEPQGWIVNLPQIGLALLFASMLVSVFMPGAKVFLHVVAALGVAAAVWYARMLFTGPQLEVLCLPALPIWFAYYALCIFGNRH